ncbi:hypothetical protein [Paenibacillus mucilaginosus]|uniref:Uncharacterized protein n=3 Tax=Paenibacillus mucilaginosus TaxID=61624 RepID=H6NSS0_9BACL|nr:hypothetical protein [Paenibacillus mucilaginosus]AEI38671.1 hypothetical protein KNP414_00019 [Paenibacillus mucilaginosus KNP414]AFC27010.1 hypothetical protein PM3016_18 [Paenibacillus mucilaginosus 3016]AFH59143.1 hypothetical protein B2K_00080 [Paenibacillus mucilaginosus K02]MCG7215811.1 hypothetical protein [Paenibacillus mucilaginosus]WDM27761.1 hypothetical protein KCX80_00110 [Paenibacillus mucilaginosus]
MTKNKSGVDKNLQNVVEDLEVRPVNSHQAQQIQQQTNDHRHQDSLNHDKEPHAFTLTDKD